MAKKQRKKQNWPYKLTLGYKKRRWVKRYTKNGKQHTWYFPVPEEIRDNDKKLAQHNRKVWKNEWLPFATKLQAEKADRDKEEIRSRWDFRLQRTPLHLARAKETRDRELFCNLLLYSLIDEYQVHAGENFTHEKYQQVHQHPYDYPEVFGYVLVEGTERFQLPPEKQRLAEESDTTVEALIVRFIDEKDGEVTPNRIKMLRGCLADFQQFIQGKTDFAEIDEQTLKDYRVHILNRMNAGRFGDERANDFLNIAKQFIRWCVAQSSLVSQLEPAVASSIHGLLAAKRVLTIKKTLKAVDAAPLDRVQAFLKSDKITYRNKFYALLALNCGMTPIDIVDFRWDQIENGVLTYKRHKEREEERVPTVKYPLWAITQEYMAKFRKKDMRVVPKSESTIGGTFRNNKKKAGFNDLTLGSIKKCSTSLLAEEYNDDLSNYFAGHSPNDIGRRHYIKPSDKNLAEALQWLETVYFPKDGNTTTNTTGNTQTP